MMRKLREHLVLLCQSYMAAATAERVSSIQRNRPRILARNCREPNSSLSQLLRFGYPYLRSYLRHRKLSGSYKDIVSGLPMIQQITIVLYGKPLSRLYLDCLQDVL